MAVAHGLQLGFLAQEHVLAAIDRGSQIDFEQLLEQLRRSLPNFGKEMH